ncbi:K(+)/H(+) antiporter NhaP [Rubripirellula amarantea]|uniref:K(+)/H(+) antiporter NhaP n=1 Tax=Rubripirellula amarantea TaxID=2527999 RepID=A0A5C5WCX2_9BACT|nr:cation:proton antiporter [Rubripirellula amarantea]TWT47925.1 K(+)/H(+) antiporter NhaP [Rubripirellula amarantea]
MDEVAIWSLVIGTVFLLAAFAKGPLRQLPVSMPVIYLLVGIAIGPWGLGLVKLNLTDDAKLIEVLTEIAVLVSLLTAGMKLKPSWSHLRRSPIPLATVAMTLTIIGIAAVGCLALGLSLGAAVLLGAVLAPTDPVLAGEVQVRHDDDRDKLRYALTGEAGLNDGAAFPFVMLGLGLLGLHELGDGGWRWFAVDLVWAIAAGIGCGWIAGYGISRLSVWLNRSTAYAAVCEELLTLGLIGFSYGAAIAIHSYGFLAVFASGVALRCFAEDEEDEEDEKRGEDDAERLMNKVASINNTFGEILEVALVVLIGCLLCSHWTLPTDWWIAIVMFAIIRPISTYAALVQSETGAVQKKLIAFFGIRGIGSLYYLSYAAGKGLDEATTDRLGGIVLTTIALSLLIHSNFSTPLLSFYASRAKGESA